MDTFTPPLLCSVFLLSRLVLLTLTTCALVPPLSCLRRRLSSDLGCLRYTLLAFFNMFIQAPLLDPDAAVRAAIQPLAEWWCLACMNTAGGAGALSQAAHNPANPHESARLALWVSRVRDSQMAHLGHGGPGLSNATFARGVDTIRNTMEANLQDRLQYERDRSLKTFSGVHGDALAQVMFRLCGCIDDSGLPPVHGLLLKTQKARVYGKLMAMFAEHAAASTVPLTTAMATMATTKLVDEVFRSYMPGSDGLTFGKGLSPFAIICPGHDGIAAVQQRIQQAQLVEAGSCVTLSDASALIADDVRLPAAPFVAVEKLYSWSVVVDVFLGVGHTVSINLRNAVLLVGPLLQCFWPPKWATTLALAWNSSAVSCLTCSKTFSCTSGRRWQASCVLLLTSCQWSVSSPLIVLTASVPYQRLGTACSVALAALVLPLTLLPRTRLPRSVPRAEVLGPLSTPRLTSAS